MSARRAPPPSRSCLCRAEESATARALIRRYAWGVVGHLNGVKNSDPLREAHAAMQPKARATFAAAATESASRR